jgi:N6-L-threonylcarbamoyladenine synthase
MEYFQSSLIKLDSLRQRDDFLILAIETSCDETSVAVTKGRSVLSNVIESQINIHRKFGGVVPEIASRNHAINIDRTLKTALENASVELNDIDVFAVTYGPGLLGALLVGVCYAKALAYAKNKPLIAVNHIKGHIAANYISYPTLAPPFICLLVSGGHTEILKVNSFNDIVKLSSTRDDAAGEAFDKVARTLSLPYPGGPEIESLAKKGSPNYVLPRAFKNEKHFDFSFSGLKTAIINIINTAKQKGQPIIIADLASSFQTEVVSVLVKNAIELAKKHNINPLTLAGGVGANEFLRSTLVDKCDREGINVILPPKIFCTDNAAMIGVAAFEEIKSGKLPATLALDADPALV